MSEATAAAQAALTELDVAVDALPNRVELERARDAHATASTLADAIDAARTAEAEATAATEQVAAVAERADTHLRDAEVALERARDAHAAHALATHLVAGEPCPVCLQAVDQVPKRKRPAQLGKAEAAFFTGRGRTTSAALAAAD